MTRCCCQCCKCHGDPELSRLQRVREMRLSHKPIEQPQVIHSAIVTRNRRFEVIPTPLDDPKVMSEALGTTKEKPMINQEDFQELKRLIKGLLFGV